MLNFWWARLPIKEWFTRFALHGRETEVLTRPEKLPVGEVQRTVIMSRHLTDSERLHIVEEYLGSPGSKHALEKKYNIARGLIKHWPCKVGLEDKILPEQMMKTSPHPKSDLTLREKEVLI